MAAQPPLFPFQQTQILIKILAPTHRGSLPFLTTISKRLKLRSRSQMLLDF